MFVDVPFRIFKNYMLKRIIQLSDGNSSRDFDDWCFLVRWHWLDGLDTNDTFDGLHVFASSVHVIVLIPLIVWIISRLCILSIHLIHWILRYIGYFRYFGYSRHSRYIGHSRYLWYFGYSRYFWYIGCSRYFWYFGYFSLNLTSVFVESKKQSFKNSSSKLEEKKNSLNTTSLFVENKSVGILGTKTILLKEFFEIGEKKQARKIVESFSFVIYSTQSLWIVFTYLKEKSCFTWA